MPCFEDEIEKISNIEVGFLILHAILGVIAIECKSLKEFQQRRYIDSKKQLDKADVLLANVLKMLTSAEQPNSIPVAKVVSFSFVQMKQCVKNPYNLGQSDIDKQPELWDNLLKENRHKHNKFMDPGFQLVLIFLLGLYSVAGGKKSGDQNLIVEQACYLRPVTPTIQSISHYLEPEVERNVSTELDFFFLYPGQLQVVNCYVNKQLITGGAKTGKTVVLMEKAFDLLVEGESVCFLIPLKLRKVYQRFLKRMGPNYRGRIYYHETITGITLEQLEDSTLVIDDLQNFYATNGDILDQSERTQDLGACKENSKCTVSEVCELLRKTPKAVVTLSPFIYPVNGNDYQQQLLDSGFQLFRLLEQIDQQPTTNDSSMYRVDDGQKKLMNSELRRPNCMNSLNHWQRKKLAPNIYDLLALL